MEMLEIRNKTLFYLKNWGLLIMLPIGIISCIVQYFYQKIFPYNLIWMVISLLFQLVGWGEPVWFLADTSTLKQKNT